MKSAVLITDGSSDLILKWPCQWLFRRHDLQVIVDRANLSGLKNPPKTLADKIRFAHRLYDSADCLLVHRDAEKVDNWQKRKVEIDVALEGFTSRPAVAVIPVIMSEAWFLFDPAAIRRAAGNPNGKADLGLPPLKKLESTPNPKELLFAALRSASESRGRKLDSLNLNEARHRVASEIRDYTPLLVLDAFQALDREIATLAAL